MTRHLLLRPGDAPEKTLAEIRAHAEGEGFRVVVQTRIGRLPILEKPGFAARWAEIRPQVERRKISLREAARQLGCGAATLHRLLHAEEPAPARPRRHPP